MELFPKIIKQLKKTKRIKEQHKNMLTAIQHSVCMELPDEIWFEIIRFACSQDKHMLQVFNSISYKMKALAALAFPDQSNFVKNPKAIFSQLAQYHQWYKSLKSSENLQIILAISFNITTLTTIGVVAGLLMGSPLLAIIFGAMGFLFSPFITVMTFDLFSPHKFLIIVYPIVFILDLIDNAIASLIDSTQKLCNLYYKKREVRLEKTIDQNINSPKSEIHATSVQPATDVSKDYLTSSTYHPGFYQSMGSSSNIAPINDHEINNRRQDHHLLNIDK